MLDGADREHFIAVAKRARSHGPIEPPNCRPRRPRTWISVAVGLAVALTVALGLVAAAHFAYGSADSPPPKSGPSAVHITKVSECTTQWSRGLSNNTEGTVSLVSGTRSFQTISADRKEIAVAPGQSVDGKVVLLARNGGAVFAVAPFIYTPSWGAPDRSWQLIAKSVPGGTALYSTDAHLIAPSSRGIYHVIFAFQHGMTGADVASGTDWAVGHDVWNDGSVIADFSSEQIHEAQTFGCTTARWLETTGYGTLSVPADAITINVR